jgi:hypothetical protein
MKLLFTESCHLTLQVGLPVVGVPVIEAVEPTVSVKPL